MSNTTITYNSGGLCTLLFITFLVLKLCNVITWSWWWVTAPLWIPFGIFLFVLFIIAIYILLTALIFSKYE